MFSHRLGFVVSTLLALELCPLAVAGATGLVPPEPLEFGSGQVSTTAAPLLSPQMAGVQAGQLIALPRAGVGRATIEALIKDIAETVRPQRLELLAVPDRSNRHHVALIGTDPTKSAPVAKALVSSGLFDAVEYNRKQIVQAYKATPNDPQFNQAAGLDQWGLKNFPGARFNEVWPLMNLLGPADSAPVAVIDTAFDLTHEDSGANIVGVWDYGDDDADVSPDEAKVQSHGTAVASTIAAATDNGVGMAGAAWDNQVLCYKVGAARDAALGDGSMSDDAVIEAMLDAPTKGAKVINLSLGNHEKSAVYDWVIDELETQGVVIVAAAGNDAQTSDDPALYPANAPSYPAGYDRVLSVGALAEDAERAYFSNYNPLTKVALTAPGADITVSTPAYPQPYQRLNGTSFAAPLTAAAAALVMRARPGLSAAAVRSILISTAVDTGNASAWDASGYGSGTLDAKAAVDKALTTPTPPWFIPPHNGQDWFYYGEEFVYPLGIGGNPKPSAAVAAGSVLPAGLKLVNDPLQGWIFRGKIATPGVYSIIINAVVDRKVIATRTIKLSICGYGTMTFTKIRLVASNISEGETTKILTTVVAESGDPAGWWEVTRTDTGAELARGAWFTGDLSIDLPVLPPGQYGFKLNVHMAYGLGQQWSGSSTVGPLTVKVKPTAPPIPTTATPPGTGAANVGGLGSGSKTTTAAAKIIPKVKVKRKGRKLTITVKASGRKATGKVRIKYGVKKLTKTKTAKLKKGKKTFTLPSGRYRVQVSYLGNAKTAKKTLKVKRYKFS